MALIGSIHNFNPRGENWILYEEQLEQFFQVNNITDVAATETAPAQNKRVAALLSLIGPDTYKMLRDLCTPQMPKDKTYDELCTLLRKQFSPTTCTYRERIEFYDARQEENETINEWYARIHKLGINCDFRQQLNHVLKDKFICSMKKNTIRERLCEEKPEQTLEKLVEIALNRESTILATTGEVNILQHKRGNGFPATRNHRGTNERRQKQGQNKDRQESSKGETVYTGNSNAGKWKCKCCGNMHTG